MRRNPARRVTGGGGPVGEKQEETEGYLRVALARKEKAGGGGSVASGRPAGFTTAAAMFRGTGRLRVEMGRPGSCLGVK